MSDEDNKIYHAVSSVERTILEKKEALEFNDATLQVFINNDRVQDIIGKACEEKIREMAVQDRWKGEAKQMFYIASALVGVVGAGFFVVGLILNDFAFQYLGGFFIVLVLISLIERGRELARASQG